MARARLIKPQFFLDESVADLSETAQLLFIGLWTLSDREGRLEDKPRQIKAQVFPYRPVEMDAKLDELAQAQLIQRYQVNGKCLIQIRSFTKHQHCNIREAQSILPAPPSTTFARANTRLARASLPEAEAEAVTEAEAEAVGTTTLQDSTIVEPKPSTRTPPSSPEADRIFEHWKTTLKHPQAIFTSKRRRLVADRLKEGYSVAQLIEAIDGCAMSPFHQGENKDGTVFDDLELICRSGEKVEQFIGFTATQGRANGEILRRTAPRRESENERRLRQTVEHINAAPEGVDADRAAVAPVSRLASSRIT